MSTPIKDMTNIKVGALMPIKIEKINKKSLWLCKCDCGNYCYKKGGDLRQSLKMSNSYLTCGCSSIKIDGKRRTLVGVKSSLLTIEAYDKNKKLYLCIDKNGNNIFLPCCLIKHRLFGVDDYDKRQQEKQDLANKYGYTSINEYNKASIHLHHIFVLMKNRCYNTNNDNYKYYGGKGIAICDQWLNNPTEFVHWSMLNGYKPNLQIDRKNSNGNYKPDNCRWVDKITNMNNKSNNLYITIDGVKNTLAEWCRLFNLNYKYTHYLIKHKNKQLKDLIKKG